MSWEKYSFVKYAPLRSEVLKILDTEKTPKEIKDELHKSDSNVARALRELTKKGLVKCLTPKSKKGKIYVLTKEGREIRTKLLKQSL
ncbi:transcriptional regulator [Candidatus Woesearchaeota archaeon]|nr:transcriptional regulator [Candidatus Woesearchaeota archaeon]